MNWLLLIVAGIIVINALIGRRVGLVKIVFSMFSFIISLILTVWISPVINGMLKITKCFMRRHPRR